MVILAPCCTPRAAPPTAACCAVAGCAGGRREQRSLPRLVVPSLVGAYAVLRPSCSSPMRCVEVRGLLHLFIVTEGAGQQRINLPSSTSSSKETYRNSGKRTTMMTFMCSRPEQQSWCDLNRTEVLERFRSELLCLYCAPWPAYRLTRALDGNQVYHMGRATHGFSLSLLSQVYLQSKCSCAQRPQLLVNIKLWFEWQLIHRWVFGGALIISCFAALPIWIMPLSQGRLGMTMESPDGWTCRSWSCIHGCRNTISSLYSLRGVWRYHIAQGESKSHQIHLLCLDA